MGLAVHRHEWAGTNHNIPSEDKGTFSTYENSLARRGEAPKKVAYASSHCC
jgi:hypothetical protein